MLVQFQCGSPCEHTEEWTLDVIPREGEKVELKKYSGTVRSVLWMLNTSQRPSQYVIIRVR